MPRLRLRHHATVCRGGRGVASDAGGQFTMGRTMAREGRDWRRHGVRVVTSERLDFDTPQTPGMTRAAAINRATAGPKPKNRSSSVSAEMRGMPQRSRSILTPALIAASRLPLCSGVRLRLSACHQEWNFSGETPAAAQTAWSGSPAPRRASNSRELRFIADAPAEASAPCHSVPRRPRRRQRRRRAVYDGTYHGKGRTGLAAARRSRGSRASGLTSIRRRRRA